MVNAQTYLDTNYPKDGVCQIENELLDNFGKKRSEIEELDISEQNLERELKLEGFDKLQKLYCDYNQLTLLDCSQISTLMVLNCENNPLKEIKVSNVKNDGTSFHMFLPEDLTMRVCGNELERENIRALRKQKSNLRKRVEYMSDIQSPFTGLASYPRQVELEDENFKLRNENKDLKSEVEKLKERIKELETTQLQEYPAK